MIPVKDEDGNVIGEVVNWRSELDGSISIDMKIHPEHQGKLWHPRIGEISIADKRPR